MGRYDALKDQWAKVTGADVAAKVAAINALTVAGTAANAMLAPSVILNAIAPADLADLSATDVALLTLVLQGMSVDVSHGTTVRATIKSIFVGKAATLTNLAALVAPFDSPKVPWWRSVGFNRPVHVGDAVVAGLGASTGYAVVLSKPSFVKFNVTVDVTVTGPQGTERVTMQAAADADYAQGFAADVANSVIVRDAALATFG